MTTLIPTKCVLLPIRFQFKKYFEHNNNLDTTLTLYNNLMNNSNNNTPIEHFIQRQLWQ